MEQVNKLNKQIAQLEKQRNSVLQAEKALCLARIAEIDAILSGKTVIQRKGTKKTTTSTATKKSASQFQRGVVKAAIVNTLTQAGRPLSVEEIFTQVSAQPAFAKLTQDGLRNNIYALANSTAHSLQKVGRGQFALKAATTVTPTTAPATETPAA